MCRSKLTPCSQISAIKVVSGEMDFAGLKLKASGLISRVKLTTVQPTATLRVTSVQVFLGDQRVTKHF